MLSYGIPGMGTHYDAQPPYPSPFAPFVDPSLSSAEFSMGDASGGRGGGGGEDADRTDDPRVWSGFVQQLM